MGKRCFIDFGNYFISKHRFSRQKSHDYRNDERGQLIQVDGKNMNVLVQGTGEETIVLLPGYGTASSVIDFMPLVNELSPFYKVVVIEPFGYGLNDITEK